MWKVATLTISELIQFSRRVGTTKHSQQKKTAAERSCLVQLEAFLSKQHFWSHWQRNCSAPKPDSYQNKYWEKWLKDHRRSKFPALCTCILLGSVLVLQAVETTNIEVRRPPVWRVLFLEMCFYYTDGSNPSQIWNYLSFHKNNDGNCCLLAWVFLKVNVCTRRWLTE